MASSPMEPRMLSAPCVALAAAGGRTFAAHAALAQRLVLGAAVQGAARELVLLEVGARVAELAALRLLARGALFAHGGILFGAPRRRRDCDEEKGQKQR